MENVVYGQLLYFNLGSFKLIQSTIQPKTPIGLEYTITPMAWHEHLKLTDLKDKARDGIRLKVIREVVTAPLKGSRRAAILGCGNV